MFWPRARLFHVSAALGLLSLFVLGCGSRRAKDASHPDSVENGDRLYLPGERIELVEAPGHPTLQLIRRSGDPAGAAAVAVFTREGSAQALAVGALLEMRMKSGGGDRPLFVRAHSLGVVVAQEVESPRAAARWMTRVHAALTTKVSEAEAKSVNLAAFLKSASDRAGSPSPFLSCMGSLGAEGKEHLEIALRDTSPSQKLQFLEDARTQSAVAAQVGLSALGEPDLVDAAQKAHSGEWPPGEPLDDSWSGERQIATLPGSGGREVRVAVRVTDSEAALGGARVLRSEDHPLHARLHALNPNWVAGRVDVTLRPAGACAGITIDMGSEGKAPDPEQVAEVALLASEELEATVRQSLTEDEQSLALLSPGGAVEAAALAAWTAVRSARTGGRWQEIIEYRAPRGDTLSASTLEKTMTATAQAWDSRQIPVNVRDETGQAELWMLLASTCGTSPETEEEAGLRAMTVSALATDFNGVRGVALEPWVSAEGIGILAHAPPLRGESVARHAERVARALGSAFSGPPLDGRAVAATRDALLERIGSDPGTELITTVLGAGFPSLVDPWGNAKAISTFAVADVEHRREDLAGEPLRLSVLANGDPAQGKAAQAALTRWLAPARQHPSVCPVRTPEPAAPGVWNLETTEEEVVEGAFVGVFAPAPRVVGRATEYLLNRPGGYLDRAFSSPGLVAQVEAKWMGDETFGALRLRVSAEPHLLDAAVAQARAVLSALAEGKMPLNDAELAEIRREDLEEEARRSPRARLVALFHEGEAKVARPSAPLSADALRQFHRKLGPDSHRIVVVKRRK